MKSSGVRLEEHRGIWRLRYSYATSRCISHCQTWHRRKFGTVHRNDSAVRTFRRSGPRLAKKRVSESSPAFGAERTACGENKDAQINDGQLILLVKLNRWQHNTCLKLRYRHPQNLIRIRTENESALTSWSSERRFCSLRRKHQTGRRGQALQSLHAWRVCVE